MPVAVAAEPDTARGRDKGMEQTSRPAAGRRLAPRLAGAVLLAVTGAIHLDLYLTGYRHIPTIGWLFLLQVISAFALAVAVAVLRGPLAPAAGAGFAIATLGGYLLTVWIGLFGFQEVRTTAGLVAGIVEVAAFGVLAYAALTALPAGSPAAATVARLRPSLPGGATGAVAAAAVVALVVLGVSLGTATSATAPSGTAGSGSAGGSGPVVKIIIKNFMFSPANPDVQPGERIEVTNEDPVTHTLTAGPSAKDNNVFSTGDVGPNQTKTIDAPRHAGMYPFYCTIHHFMTGILIVGK
jgi:plastocyanin